MNKDDDALMVEHGITVKPSIIYSYKSCKYDGLKSMVCDAEANNKQKNTNENLL